MARPVRQRSSPARRVRQVQREEFESVREAVGGMRRELDTQFKRLAQIQAELDAIKKAWAKVSILP
jgi:BMFP domain-containing protein YqiC